MTDTKLPAQRPPLPPLQLENLPPHIAAVFENGSPMQQFFGIVMNELGLDTIVDWAEENMGEFMRLTITVCTPPNHHPQAPHTNINLNLPSALRPGPLDNSVTIDADD